MEREAPEATPKEKPEAASEEGFPEEGFPEEGFPKESALTEEASGATPEAETEAVSKEAAPKQEALKEQTSEEAILQEKESQEAAPKAAALATEGAFGALPEAETGAASGASASEGEACGALPEAKVRCSGLSKRYGQVWAAKDIEFRAYSGEIYGLLGPNGAGKTTTLRMIAGLLQPDSGEVWVDGSSPLIDPLESKRRIGFLTGNTGLYQRLTPREILEFFGRLHTMEPGHIERRIAELFEELDIGDFGDRPCGTLSTGQTQRVNIARTLLHEPDVLILDEPTSGLDIISAEFILQIIARCREQGQTILLSTHILAETELLCDRVGIINQGRLVIEGTIAELLEHAQTDRLSKAFLHIIKTTGQEPS